MENAILIIVLMQFNRKGFSSTVRCCDFLLSARFQLYLFMPLLACTTPRRPNNYYLLISVHATTPELWSWSPICGIYVEKLC